ncbi:hypothetical protein E2493_05760 [Sphingomonas parva]|uniref:Uncharacterized protein n=1 Tax=Sphingomonas parva TaxID=2555898 RepID=A0A4Y8ZTJ7_9SPHN|nr:hypothetical protein [Sphingomonas parva]TFI59343.1 hypothetical protein E2493_05760 [Sphingomonas parva]
MERVLLLLLCVTSACSGDDSGNVVLASVEDGEVRSPASSGVLEPERCLRKDRDYYRLKFNDACIELQPARRMSGVWIVGNEESSFIPGPQKVPAADNRLRLRIFLDTKSIGRLEAADAEGVRWLAVFAIEFIGRRSKAPGLYYTGEGDHLVVADRLISARFIGQAPQTDVAAALKAGRRFDNSELSRPLPEDIWN